MRSRHRRFLLVTLLTAGPLSPLARASSGDAPARFRPGDIYLATRGVQGQAGIYGLTPSGSCSIFFPLRDWRDSGILGYDASSDRIYTWAWTDLEGSQNFGFGLYFISAGGNYEMVDPPPGWAPVGVATDSRGRTFYSRSGDLYYFDGTDRHPLFHPLLDEAGVGPYRQLHYPITDFVYDEELNGLLWAYQTVLPAAPQLYSLGVYFLPLTPDRSQVAGPGVDYTWLASTNDQASTGLSRKRNGDWQMGMTNCCGQTVVEDIQVDPMTPAISSARVACYSGGTGAVTWHWPSRQSLLLGSVPVVPDFYPVLFVPPPSCPGTGPGMLLDCVPENAIGGGQRMITIPPFEKETVRRR